MLEQHIIATAALVFRPGDTAEIVRMSVAAGMRRGGIGRLMLDSLSVEARRRGIRRLVLETTQTWDEVVVFYLRYGFKITHFLDGDVYFAMDL